MCRRLLPYRVPELFPRLCGYLALLSVRIPDRVPKLQRVLCFSFPVAAFDVAHVRVPVRLHGRPDARTVLASSRCRCNTCSGDSKNPLPIPRVVGSNLRGRRTVDSLLAQMVLDLFPAVD